MIVGIDLGTTNSAVAWMSETGPRLIPNALGQVLTPSVVGVDLDGQILVGRGAAEFQVMHPERCASVFKRQMGTEWTTTLTDKTFTAQQLSSFVLKSLKQDAESHFGKEVGRAVISVPAYFGEPQRKATVLAGEMAGLKVEHILNEPTAAALAYGFHEAGAEQLVAVLDLGGGTFDVSVVDQFEGVMEVRASSGELYLGGEDFTRTMAARLLEQLGRNFERTEMDAPKLLSRLIQLCERAKRALTSATSTTVKIPSTTGELNEQSPVVTVTRQQFLDWTEGILGRIDLPIRRCLGDAKLKATDIGEVILVGGASRMPAFVERAARIFKKSPQQRFNPDEVVALGAGVQAGLFDKHKSVQDIVVTDVSPFTLGIEVSKKLGFERHAGYFFPIIHRNTPIPCSHSNIVQTIDPNQSEIQLKVYQGESRRVEDNVLLGSFKAEGIPRGPAGQEVDVRFTYDVNGLLEVEATVVATKRTSKLVIVRHVKGLNEKEIAAAVERMQALKTVPRNQTNNRFLLKRAERVFQEVPLNVREVLDSLIVCFEEALETQQAEEIERYRNLLEAFLEKHEQGNFDDNDDAPWK